MHVSYTGTTIREHDIIYFEDMAVSLFCKGWKVCLSSHLLHQESSVIGFFIIWYCHWYGLYAYICIGFRLFAYDMKRTMYVGMLCLVLSVMQGCQSTKNTVMTGVVDNRQEEVLLTVASETRIGYGVGPMACLLVKHEPAEKWQYMYSVSA